MNFLVNNVLKEYEDMKEKKVSKLHQLIKAFDILLKRCYLIV